MNQPTSQEMKVHELKTWSVFYEKIIDGSKPFEVRNNDRKFQVGDILFLREYDPDAEEYTGRSCQKKVTYILGDNPFFQMNNTVIMGITPIAQPSPDSQVREEQIADINFIKWYSGMEEQKIRNAFERYTREVISHSDQPQVREEEQEGQDCATCKHLRKGGYPCSECDDRDMWSPQEAKQPEVNLHFLRSNILRNLTNEEFIILRDWMNSYDPEYVKSNQEAKQTRTAEEIKHKINQIICRYHSDNDYKTPKAVSDIFALMEEYRREGLPDTGKKVMITSDEYYGLNEENPKA